MSLAGPLINSNKVVIFSWVHCPYCKKAKELLGSLTKERSIYDVDQMPNGKAIHQEIIDATGHDTVPAIYIKGKLIGGFSDTDALYKRGELTKMLS